MARLVRLRTIGGLFHGLDAGDDLLAGAVGDVQEDLGGIGDALNGGDHLIDGSGRFGDAGGLHLGVLDDVLHVDAHLVHGAGDFLDRGRGLDADLGGFVGGAGNLIGAAETCEAPSRVVRTISCKPWDIRRKACQGCRAWNAEPLRR